jgi:hypothetical protein
MKALTSKLGVASVVKSMVKSCLRLFEHVPRRHIEVSVRRVDQIEDSSII